MPTRGSLNRRPDKRCALNAAPVNSTMLLVQFVVQCVHIRRTFMEKEETTVALLVQLVGLPKLAVQNVVRVVRVRLALGVKIAHWVLPEKETTVTYIKQNVLNVHRENRMSMPKQHAVLVTLVHLKAAKVFVKLV